MASIKLTTTITADEYTEYVCDNFDIQNRDSTTVEIPMNFADCKTFDWNIGVIYGGSGTGKTTLLKQFGELSKSNFDGSKALISNFDFLDPKQRSCLLLWVWVVFQLGYDHFIRLVMESNTEPNLHTKLVLQNLAQLY